MTVSLTSPATRQTNQGNFLDTPQLAPGITRFWLIRHALVEQNARLRLYGALDVPLCPDSLIAQRPMYEALAARLPRDAHWLISLSPARAARRKLFRRPDTGLCRWMWSLR